ncbi:MAG: hypothetical protein Q9218_002894 [Villophora microphyllina]
MKRLDDLNHFLWNSTPFEGCRPRLLSAVVLKTPTPPPSIPPTLTAQVYLPVNRVETMLNAAHYSAYLTANSYPPVDYGSMPSFGCNSRVHNDPISDIDEEDSSNGEVVENARGSRRVERKEEDVFFGSNPSSNEETCKRWQRDQEETWEFQGTGAAIYKRKATSADTAEFLLEYDKSTPLNKYYGQCERPSSRVKPSQVVGYRVMDAVPVRHPPYRSQNHITMPPPWLVQKTPNRRPGVNETTFDFAAKGQPQP